VDTVTKITRLTREDAPFGPDMTDYDLWKLFLVPEIAAIDKSKFPANQSLKDILKNDTRIRRFKPGEVIVREGDYGNSAFFVLNGKLRVVLSPGLPDYLSGQKQPPKKSLWKSLSQLMSSRKISEVRDINRYSEPTAQQNGTGADNHSVFLQDFSTVLNSNNTALLEEGTLFGELAALRRIPEKRYSESGLVKFLKKTPLFEHLQEETLQEIAANAVFKTYGMYDWADPYKNIRNMGKEGIKHEPVIIRQGDHPDDLLIVRAGFARVSRSQDENDQTITYLGVGHTYGADELFQAWEGEKNVSFKVSITALGYVDIIQIPATY
jgi:CRP-like cAMP-binding protein